MRVLISLLASIFCTQLWAAPPSLQQLANSLQLNQIISLGVFEELDEIIAQEQSKPRAPLIIGAHRLLDLDSSDGEWQNLNNGNRLWQLAVSSDAAKTISVLFDQFELADGAKLWVYSADKSEVLGPFTNADQNALGQFWTPAIGGDTLMIELEQPHNSTSQLHISKLDHGIKDWRNGNDVQHKDVGDSGSCNINVACPAGLSNSTKVKATAMLTIPGLLSTSLCSGTLLNNTDQDGTPYFLTANHCVSSAGGAAGARTHWEYQADSCGGASGSDSQTINVARLVATWETSDFSLLELASAPPASFSPYWSGWDRSGGDLSRGIGVHHPAGDLKKISTTNSALSIVNGGGGLGDATNANGQYVRVSPWSTGTTEGGSSGSGLWNGSNRLVGQLSAGNAGCNGNSPNGGQDYYGWIGQSWEGGGSPSSRLKDWLAPNKSSTTTLSGCDHINQSCSDGASTDSGGGGGGGGGSSTALLFLACLSLGLRRRLLVQARRL